MLPAVARIASPNPTVIASPQGEAISETATGHTSPLAVTENSAIDRAESHGNSSFVIASGEAAWQSQETFYRLTTYEKKRILLSNIYGVDIDTQAVEVTKLSLLLKVLEGESDETLNAQLRLFHERALPDLGSNIKCGNSLIGPDYYENQQLTFLDGEEHYRINAFDWQAEFPSVFARHESPHVIAGGEAARQSKDTTPVIARAESPRQSQTSEGGFDAVIGNPPYVRQESLGEFKDYFKRNYAVYHGVADLYAYFIEKGVFLLRKGGLFSYIVANKWMRANYGEPLRTWLKQRRIDEIVDFGDLRVFQRATTYPCIIRIAKEAAKQSFEAVKVDSLEFQDLTVYVDENKHSIKQAALDEKGWSLADEKSQALLNKLMSSGTPLGVYVGKKIFYGIKTGLNEAFVIDEETKAKLIAEDAKSAEIIKPFLLGRDVKRYQPLKSNCYLIFTRRGIDITLYPAISRYLEQFKERLMPKPKDHKGEWKGRKSGSYQWYEIQDTVDYYAEFEEQKIIVPSIVQKAQYAFDKNRFYSNDKTAIIVTDEPFYVLALLCSKTLDFYMHSISSTKQGGFYEYKPMYIKQLPIPTPHPRLPIPELAERMLDLNKKLDEANTAHEKNVIQRQIDATDKQIDHLVYQLYDLTPEEIAIVEEATK